MSSFVSGLLKKFFPSQDGRLLCVGLDASGRTSWLYFKVLGTVVTTIPTIGFNVETVKHSDCSMTIWDVGGCDKIRPLWRHYFQETHGLVAFVDSNDRERVDEVRKEIQALVEAPELRDAFFLVIANKQDLPNAMPPREVSERLQLPQIMASRLWTCLPGELGNKQLVNAHFDWISSALRHAFEKAKQPQDSGGAHAVVASSTPAAAPPPTASANAADPADVPASVSSSGSSRGLDVLERWLQVEDEPDEEFLRKLEDYSLESWDHRTHLRLAWLYLTRLGRREGLARIHSSIRAFIEHSSLTARRNGTTYHETMTYFWAHMVHFAIASQNVPAGATPDFRFFLLMNPQLTNGGLFLHYYSKQLMLQSPESRVRVVLPDKRPLPSIITDVASLRGDPQPRAPEHLLAASRASGVLADAEFLDRFTTRSLDRWNHECLLRAIYCCLKHHGRRRGGDVVMGGLRSLQGPDFHLTISYFWLCIVTHTLANEYYASLFAERPSGMEGADAVSNAAQALPEWPEILGRNDYTAIKLKELVADERRYLHYYSSKTIYSLNAASEFVPPDKRPLPSMA
ncbi:hypothetical protein Vafri_3881 [Volvox africanus]|uniref:ADP-ribosylation factor n=1 Tax=Volvox africanus TaxID=51714 RepID=A0A8J4AUE5_9CHLO|nr:hypothetical protein Vafri_3881 [Volvox africanus]